MVFSFSQTKWSKWVLLCGEGGEVDRNDPVLLSQLEKLYDVVSIYEPENMYNLDETELLYRLIPRHTVLLCDEVISSVRGKKGLVTNVKTLV